MSTQAVVYQGTSYTYDGLFNLSGPEQAKLFNQIAPKVGVETTKRFADKVSGAKRVWAVLQQVEPALNEGATIATAPSELDKIAGHVPGQSDEERTKRGTSTAPKPEKPVKVAKAPKAPKEPKVAKERAPRGKYFMFPARATEEQKPIKEKTMRGTLYRLMSRAYGATFEQLHAETWATKADMDEETALKTTYEAIRLVHYFNGFGIYHAANDHLFVWSTQAELKELKNQHDPKKGAAE